MNIARLTALELASKIREKEISVRQAVDATYEQIEKYDDKLKCYITLCKDEAYKQADEVQKKIDSGQIVSPLAGVPVSVKDNICTKGIKTTCASKMLENYKPVYNATVIDKLENAGMIVIGKLNMDEFSMGSTTETSAHAITSNPWNTDHVPGGSSGGSAAAVAADEAFIALGSDTGGSIRQPGSFCGVTALKPTYGTVSRRGLAAFASSLDQIGPISKTCEDCAALYEIISGKDKYDSTSMDFPKFKFSDAVNNGVKGKKIGILKEFFSDGINNDVKSAVLAASKKLEELGAEIEEFSMPIVKYSVPTYCIIASAEASSNLGRYDGIKYGYSSPDAEDLMQIYIKSRSEGFGLEVKRRIMLGNFVLSSGRYDAYYNKALKTKNLIQKALFDAFEKYDIVLTPVSPETAPKKGESISNPLGMYLDNIYTAIVNIAGVPAISIPCGFDSSGLPIGLQLIGKPFAETTLLGAGCDFQKATDYHKQKPAFTGGAIK